MRVLRFILVLFFTPSVVFAAILAPHPELCYLDANGDPLASGKLYTYETGTTTPLASYTDSGGGTPNANPVVLDTRGCADVWLDPDETYRFKLDTSADVTVFTIDGIAGDQSTPSVPNPSTGTSRDYLGVNGSAWALYPGLPTPVGETAGDAVVVNATSTGFEVSAITSYAPNPTTGSAGQVPAVNSGATDYEFVTPAPKGMVMSGCSGGDASLNSSDPSNDLDFTAITCTDSTGAVAISTSATHTKRLDAAYADDTGNGGLLNGSKTASETYLWVLMGDGGTNDGQIGFLDIDDVGSIATHVTSAGYDYYKVIGFWNTNSSNAWAGFTNKGDYMIAHVASESVLSTGVTTTLAAVDHTALVAEAYTELIWYGARDASETTQVYASDDGTNVSFSIAKTGGTTTDTNDVVWGGGSATHPTGYVPYLSTREFVCDTGTVDLLLHGVKFKR